MKKLLLVGALALAGLGTAGACPVKSGWVAQNVMRIPSEMVPECGAMYELFRGKLQGGNIRWSELYRVTRNHEAVAARLDESLRAQGFVMIKKTKISPQAHQLGFINATTNKVLLVQLMAINGQVYVALLGN